MEENETTASAGKPTRIGPKFVSNRVRRMAESINNLQTTAANIGGVISMSVSKNEDGKDVLSIDGVDFRL